MADTKISALSAVDLDGDEYIPVVDDPSGTPASGRVTASSLLIGPNPLPIMWAADADVVQVPEFLTYNVSGSLTASRLYVTPMVISTARTFTSMRVWCTTAGTAAARVRLGIYNWDRAVGEPTTLIVESGEIDVSSTGVKTDTISQLLRPGVYGMAMVTNEAIATQGGTVSVQRRYPAAGSGQNVYGMYIAHTYGALPADVSSSSWFELASAMPIFGIR